MPAAFDDALRSLRGVVTFVLAEQDDLRAVPLPQQCPRLSCSSSGRQEVTSVEVV
jgi:hypothetical protein